MFVSENKSNDTQYIPSMYLDIWFASQERGSILSCFLWKHLYFILQNNYLVILGASICKTKFSRDSVLQKQFT